MILNIYLVISLLCFIDCMISLRKEMDVTIIATLLALIVSLTPIINFIVVFKSVLDLINWNFVLLKRNK